MINPFFFFLIKKKKSAWAYKSNPAICGTSLKGSTASRSFGPHALITTILIIRRTSLPVNAFYLVQK